MFRVSRRIDYGVQLMIALAQTEADRPVPTAVLAEKLHIPLPFLHQIGRSLIQSGYVRATPGPRGGLRLKQPAENISLLQIIEALEGPMRIVPESNGNGMMTREVWAELQEKVITALASIRLSELAKKAPQGTMLSVESINMADRNN